MTKNLNQRTADFLDTLALSERARYQIDTTDFNSLYDLFGGCETAEDVEELVAEMDDGFFSDVEAGIVAYVGTIYDYINEDTTEDEIRDMITADMKLMDEEQRKFTEDHLEEIIREALLEAQDK